MKALPKVNAEKDIERAREAYAISAQRHQDSLNKGKGGFLTCMTWALGTPNPPKEKTNSFPARFERRRAHQGIVGQQDLRGEQAGSKTAGDCKRHQKNEQAPNHCLG